MHSKFLDPRQTDTERIRDLWIKCDQLDDEARDLRVAIRHFLEMFDRTIGMMDNDNADPIHVFMLRHLLDGLEQSLNKNLEDHKPF